MNRKIFAALIITSLLLAGCSNVSIQPSSSFGQVNGSVVQETSLVNTSGTIKLMKEEYLTATPNAAATSEPDKSVLTASIDKDGKFAFSDVQSGRYYLDVSVTLNPCFLGAPGQIFNGMMISFMDNWSPTGLSFKDGSSLIMGNTDVYDVTSGNSLDITLQLPKCY